MVLERNAPSPARTSMLQWAGCLGAITPEALAECDETTVTSARGRLSAATRDGLLARCRPLAGRPPLYTLTAAGARASGIDGLDRCRVSPSNAAHLIASAQVAGALEHCYPDHRVAGERELRRAEHVSGVALASALLGTRPDGAPLLHRPDLVLWPTTRGRLPVAVEVELTVKAPRRLSAICRAWARCRLVAGVLYLAAPEVERALACAIEAARAGERVVVVPLAALPSSVRPTIETPQSSVPRPA